MADKKSIVVYEGWASMILNLPDEMAGDLIKNLLAYAFKGEEPETDNPAIGAILVMMKDKLDEDAAKYEETVKQRSEAGKKAMQKRWSATEEITEDSKAITKDNGVITNDNAVKERITKITDSVSVSDSVSDSVSVSESDTVPPTEVKKERATRKRFAPPSIEEVAAYCRERGNNVDPETFVDFYSSKGWKVGKEPMKDWRACVRTWEKRDRASPGKKPGGFDSNDYLLGIIGGGGV